MYGKSNKPGAKFSYLEQFSTSGNLLIVSAVRIWCAMKEQLPAGVCSTHSTQLVPVRLSPPPHLPKVVSCSVHPDTPSFPHWPELQIFERLHRKILQTSQGLPTRCPSLALLAMVGMQSVEDLIKQRKLSFIRSTANHPPYSLPRRVLEARAGSDCANSIVANFKVVISKLNLLDLSHILAAQPSVPFWKRHTKNHLATKRLLQHIEDCADYHASACEFRPLKPAKHWSITVSDLALTQLNNFRIRLLVGCDGLEKDAARFRSRNTGRLVGDPSCWLRGHSPFYLNLPGTQVHRHSLLDDALPIISTMYNMASTSNSNPQSFADVILGTCWIDDPEVQSFCIQFLSSLKEARAALFLSMKTASEHNAMTSCGSHYFLTRPWTHLALLRSIFVLCTIWDMIWEENGVLRANTKFYTHRS